MPMLLLVMQYFLIHAHIVDITLAMTLVSAADVAVAIVVAVVVGRNSFSVLCCCLTYL